MADPAVQHLAIESWTLYALGLLVVSARITSQILHLGSWRKLPLDNWIMLFVVCTFTGVIVATNQVSQNLSNYLPPGMAETFTPEEHDNAVYGSKMVMVLEECMLTNTWLVKACLLLMYNQLTSRTNLNTSVKYVGAYCVLGYVITQILYLGVWCRPIQQYWAVPVQNSQCASYYHHLITSSVFNISSDLMILCIPLPMLYRLKLRLKRKLILGGVFSLGIFVILAAILNRYYNFTEPYGSLVYLNWYVGESATSVFVANVPLCWPLLSRIFHVGSFNSSRGRSNLGNGRTDPSSNALRSESKERITDGRNSRYYSQSGDGKSESERAYELGKLGEGRYATRVTGGGVGEGRLSEGEGGSESDIVKTVHIQVHDEGQAV